MHRLLVSCATVLALMAPCESAIAQAEARSDALRSGLYLAPLLSYASGNGDRDAGSGLGYGVALGHRGGIAGVELVGEVGRLKSSDGRRDDQNSLGLNLLFAPLQSQVILRDAHALLGYAVTRGRAADGGKASILDLGLGYTPSVRIFGLDLGTRFEIIYRRGSKQSTTADDASDGASTLVVRLGLQVPLSPTPRAVPARESRNVQVLEPARDTDADSVPDEQDVCPGTDLGVAVDDSGCESL